MILEIKGLSKRYNKKASYAITDINLNAREGEIVGIVGHNGAGKSTTIKCFTSMHPYDEGTIIINGYNLKKQPIEAKKSFGYVSDEFTIFENMTGYEFLNFMADVYKVDKDLRKTRILELEKTFALGDSIYKIISSYSHGMKQKISIMGALIHKPKLFILDEPMVGLDPATINQVINFIFDYAKNGNTVVFTSHNLDIIHKLCNRVYIIDQGKLLEEIDMEKYKNQKDDFENHFLEITNRVASV